VKIRNKRLKFIFLLGLLSQTGCLFTDNDSMPPRELSLYSGVIGVVTLGDSVETVQSHLPEKPALRSVAGTELGKIEFNGMFDLTDQGMRIYFRRGRVALIEFQEPFKGTVRGKDLTLFPFSAPSTSNWEEFLIRKFGVPQQRVSGGRLGSKSLFYSWGDISYNGMGPNEIALYREPDVINYRQQNFGRVLKFFGN
jgi:hypothetical protein